jgi:hypothetical protein
MSAHGPVLNPKDPILWGAVGCALVSTAYSEWNLAVAVGAHSWVALAVPGALDLYVLRALQARRDVFLAVLAMVAANVAWYLVHSGDLPVGWPLRSAVGALAPLVLWRVYSLKYARHLRNEEPSAVSGAVSAPDECAPGTALATSAPECPLSEPFLMDLDHECSGCGQPWGTHPEVLRKRAEHAAKYAAPETAPETAPECHFGSECTTDHAPEYVPADWSADPVPYLRAVPALAPDFDPTSAVHSFPDVAYLKASALHPGDEAHLPSAREYLDNCALTDTEPSIKGLAREGKIGQAKAKRLLAHLAEEEL